MNAAAGKSIFDAILQFNADREPDLVRLKLKRLDESVFCFFRGTDELFGKAWQDLRPRDPGPAILCTGDMHLENFGACQSQEGDFRFEINDFDEALIAPCSFDLVRCTASILLAAEIWGLSPLESSGVATAFLDQYQRAVIDAVDTGTVGQISPRSGEAAGLGPCSMPHLKEPKPRCLTARRGRRKTAVARLFARKRNIPKPVRSVSNGFARPSKTTA